MKKYKKAFIDYPFRCLDTLSWFILDTIDQFYHKVPPVSPSCPDQQKEPAPPNQPYSFCAHC